MWSCCSRKSQARKPAARCTERDGETKRERERYAGGRWSLKYDGRDSLTIALSDTDPSEDEIIPSVSFTPLCSTIVKSYVRFQSVRSSREEAKRGKLNVTRCSLLDSRLVLFGEITSDGCPGHHVSTLNPTSQRRDRVSRRRVARESRIACVSRRAPWDDWLFSVAERESIAATRASRRPMIPRRSPPVSRWWKHMEGWLAPGGQLPLTWPRCTRPPRRARPARDTSPPGVRYIQSYRRLDEGNLNFSPLISRPSGSVRTILLLVILPNSVPSVEVNKPKIQPIVWQSSSSNQKLEMLKLYINSINVLELFLFILEYPLKKYLLFI